MRECKNTGPAHASVIVLGRLKGARILAMRALIFQLSKKKHPYGSKDSHIKDFGPKEHTNIRPWAILIPRA